MPKPKIVFINGNSGWISGFFNKDFVDKFWAVLQIYRYFHGFKIKFKSTQFADAC